MLLYFLFIFGKIKWLLLLYRVCWFLVLQCLDFILIQKCVAYGNTSYLWESLLEIGDETQVERGPGLTNRSWKLWWMSQKSWHHNWDLTQFLSRNERKAKAGGKSKYRSEKCVEFAHESYQNPDCKSPSYYFLTSLCGRCSPLFLAHTSSFFNLFPMKEER